MIQRSLAAFSVIVVVIIILKKELKKIAFKVETETLIECVIGRFVLYSFLFSAYNSNTLILIAYFVFMYKFTN